MYIYQIILDGFKSYATRTVIGPFDPQFNAITGLNGSGKSNILDAICFVLGISMDKVRANTLTDLIYKKGQAGISKASVTIVFDNSDKSKSPPKYVSCDTISVTRQIILNGKSKYLVNGKNETQLEVTSMFQSIQLNIQNPNFLIMQGKITHVLNMKPNQILGMVEEAAGTRLYEDRKEKAIKIMEKKDSKLVQSAILLETEVTPKLDELREKKRVFLEHQKVNLEMEQIEKVVVAFNFTNLNSQMGKNREKHNYYQQRLDHLNSMSAGLLEEIADLQERITQVNAERSNNGGAFFELEEHVKNLAKDVAKCKTLASLKSTAIVDEKSAISHLQTQMLESKQSLKLAVDKSDDLEKKCRIKMNDYQSKCCKLTETESLVQTLTTGMGASEGQENGYMDQLANAKQDASTASAEIQQIKLKLAHLVKELKVEEPKAKKAKKDNEALVSALDSKRNVVSMIKEQLATMQYNPQQDAPLLDQKQELENELKAVSSEIGALERTIPGINFEYSNPTPNFDRSKVKGLVATLVSISKENFNKAAALEVCAGGKLYQVVVETQEIAKQLIKNGKLSKRVTIIPLNKISSFQVQAERIATAKKLAPGDVDLALTLVGSDKDVQMAMNFVFGSTLICRDHSVAKRVTFDKKVNLRSVTFDGDIYDPSGQLSGGAKSNTSGMLLTMQSLRELKGRRDIINTNLANVTAKLNDLKAARNLYESRKKELDMKQHELSLQENRVSNNPHFKIIQRVDELIESHKSSTQDLESAKSKLTHAKEKIASVESEMAELSSNRESKVDSLKKLIASLKKQLAEMEPDASKIEEEILLSKEEVNEIEHEILNITNSINTAEKLVLDMQNNAKEISDELKGLETKYQFAADRLAEERKSLVQFDKKLSSLEKGIMTKTQALEDNKIDAQQLSIDLKSVEKELGQVEKKLSDIRKNHIWIPDQQKLFGIEGSPYDFRGVDMEELLTRVALLKSRSEQLGRSLDKSALEMLDRVEKREIELKQKLSTVQKDKTSIQSTLEYLDRKKLDQLQKTWEKVNRDFGAIFDDLLPGNTCKLEAPSGMKIQDGLEIRVCLGGVWKQSLAELSGGQRSLIALSLILALLQFNPAPMYILDEVDAALDLSHTQNIGKLLRSRFKTSQFVLVSLKDGMYNNANVLFRTKFVDGVSQVDRREMGKISSKSLVTKNP